MDIISKALCVLLIYFILAPMALLFLAKESNKLKYKKYSFILPKSFFATVSLIPIALIWLFLIVSLSKIDETVLIIFCSIITPFFYWWLFSKIEHS